ncbi:MAG: efflux RND transporter permease subunit [Alphaproteobacteria bacterium]|nr:efflux RND transporter permease subunit [Alphaproteobacteria bacterium]
MGWARWLVDHAVTVVILVGTILIFGISAYVTLPREAAPDIKIPVVIVSTPYFGVSPADIETLVTIPMERKLKDVKDVDEMRSTSYEGASVITLEFNPDVDIEDALQKVREKVDAAQPDLPEDAEDPVVSEISFSDIPILIVSMTGPQDEEELKLLAEGLEDRIEAIPGVLDVKLSGGLTRELRVLAQPDRMARYDVSFDDIIRGIQSENVNIPGGNVDADSSDYLLRVPGELESAEQIAAVPVKNVGGRTLFVRDVARVVDGYADRATYSRMNGSPSLSLGVQKRVGENIVDLAAAVRAEVATTTEAWPEGVQTAILADQSRYIENSVTELENNIISGLLLVVGVLLFFMGFRNSWFVGLAIPLSMFVSFMTIQALGITLNMIVLFSLILALGMLVDNAIVIVENIYRHHEEGKDLREASIIGVSEVALPVATSTLTTCLAFAPLLFWEGVMGEFMGYLPRTLIIVLTSSLFVALVVIPVATSRLMKPVQDQGARVEGELPPPDTLLGKVMARYKGILEWSIDHRYLSIGAGVVTLLVSVVVYAMFNHGTEFFPQTEPNQVIIGITAPDGTRLETTDRFARQLEQVLGGEGDVDTFVTEVGRSAGSGGLNFGASSVPHAGKISIDYRPTKGNAREGEQIRSGSTFDSVERLRTAAAQVVGANVTVDPRKMGPPVGMPIEVEISGPDFHELGRISQDFQRKLRAVPGVVDIKDDYRVGRPELRFTIDRAAAKKLGASTLRVANTLRTAVAGTKASVVRDGEDEYDIIVELDPVYTANAQSVLDLRIPGKDNIMVPLGTLASYEALGGSGAIKHLDRDKVITVSGDIEGVNVNVAQTAVKELMDGFELPDGYAMNMGGADREQAKTMVFLLRSFGIALVLIFLVLVTQFDSISRPFIILASVVLSLIGVLWGLLLTSTPFGILMTGIGVISLAGVVVNNAIVLIDYVQLLRKRGMDVREALIQAGIVRFRPVILTAITTILGLIPMATGLSIDFRKLRVIVGGESAAFWGPMAIAVCFGLAVATLLTLVMVPTMYSITEDLGGLVRRGGRRKAGVAAAGAAAALLLAPLNAWGGEPVSLAQAISAAEQNNLDLRMVEEQTVQARAQVGMAWAQLTPKVNVQGTYTINKDEVLLDFSEIGDAFSLYGTALEAYGLAIGDYVSNNPQQVSPETWDALQELADSMEDVDSSDSSFSSEPTVIQAKTAKAANASIIQPIFTAASVPALKGAYALRDAALSTEDFTRMRIHGATTQAYYGLVVSNEAVAISEEALANARKHLDLAKRQVAAGAAPPLAELQAELAVSQSERQLRASREQLVTAAEAFAFVTGLPTDSQVTMPAPPSPGFTSANEAVDVAIDRRPDLLAARLQADASRMMLRADQLGWLPTVNGRFTWSWTENPGFQDSNDWWMIVLTADWTLWDGGYRLATNKQYASQRRVADYAAEKARMQAEQDVRVAWERYERAEVAFQAVEREIALAEESLRLAELGFEAGSSSWLEAEDARLALASARLGMLTERMNRDLAIVQLAVATGTYTP